MVYPSCSIACENRYCHSALGGGAAPSPLFFVQVTFAIHFSACVSIYIYEYECVFWHVALPVKTGIVILLWGEALRPPPIPPPASLLKSHLHCTSLHVYIYMCVFACSVACENRYCHCALPPSRFYIQVTLAMHFSACVCICTYVCVVILLWGEALRPCFCFDLIPTEVHA